MRCGAVRCGVAWRDVVWRGVEWCGAVRCGAVRCGAVRCGAVRWNGRCRQHFTDMYGDPTWKQVVYNSAYGVARRSVAGCVLRRSFIFSHGRDTREHGKRGVQDPNQRLRQVERESLKK